MSSIQENIEVGQACNEAISLLTEWNETKYKSLAKAIYKANKELKDELLSKDVIKKELME